MSKPLYINKLALLVAIEDTAGTAVVPTVAGSVRVSDVTLTPMEGDEVSENVVRPFFGASESVLATIYRKVAFSVGFAGVPAVGQLPAYELLLRGCAISATNTPATSTVFAPVTDDIESLSIHAVIDKQLYKMSGARGTVKAQVDAKGIPKFQFEFTGAFHPVTAVANMPAVDYSKYMNPMPVNAINTTLQLDGFDAACSSFVLDVGNNVVKQDLINVDTTEITGRESTLNVTVRNTDVATKNFIEMAMSGAKVPLLLKHGQAATNTVSIAAPLAQIGKPTFGEQDGIQMITVPLRFIPSDAGNDEWSITV